jgi:hypothetical protein
VEVTAAKPDPPVERPVHRAPVINTINTTAEAAEREETAK